MAVIKTTNQAEKRGSKKDVTLHQELVKRAERWLLRTAGCGFVISELVSITMETPDAIGWKWGQSILLECKASRADFLSDKKKIFRKNPEMGMGTYRFYFCPPGIIKPGDLPEKWGLLYCHPKKVEKVIAPKGNIWTAFPSFKANLKAEIHLMCSALRRVHIRGDLEKIYNSNLQITN